MAPLGVLALASLLASASALSTAKARAGAARSGRTCRSSPMTFSEYVQKFRKGYEPGSAEYERRRELFEERVGHIDDHNCKDLPWTAGINRLTDWTEAELHSLRGYRGREQKDPESLISTDYYANLDSRPSKHEYPETVDWSSLHAIKEPRDQGQCGSCWAFASLQVLRAHAEIKGWPSNFSVSQVISCTANPNECGGTGGCNGATVELAFDYVLRMGVKTEEALPYPEGGGEGKCPAQLKGVPAQQDGMLEMDGSEVHMIRGLTNSKPALGRGIGMVGWTKFPENRVDRMLRGLVEEGPVAVAVAAGRDWNYYTKGIMLTQGCDTSFVISHAVVLFGYGVVGRRKFWRVKNSWGPEWGEQGNLRLQRLDHEELFCGWDNEPEVGSGCKGGPSRVWACGSCGILYDTAMPHFVPFSHQAVTTD
mmetsp:Transcript_85536/g.250418  ORF Transcript_85536/g.250418 Transcript_85536/m.250418 type:complete len:423 (+) Transcript_85536:69-1337(+)